MDATATTHGGQETTLVTMMVSLLHLGLLIVGVPYSLPRMIHTEARGTPYWATAIAASKGEFQPTADDLTIAQALGRRLAEILLVQTQQEVLTALFRVEPATSAIGLNSLPRSARCLKGKSGRDGIRQIFDKQHVVALLVVDEFVDQLF